MLEEALASALAGNFDPVTATRLWSSGVTGEIAPAVLDAAVPSESEADSDEPGVFELLATMEASFPELYALAEQSTEKIQALVALTDVATKEVQAGNAAKTGFTGRLLIANKLAANLSPLADEFESLAAAYEEQLANVDAGMTCLLDVFENNPAEIADAGEFPEQLSSFVTTVKQVNEQQATFAASMVDAGNFSKPLRIVTRRIAEATKRVAKALAMAEVWDARMTQLVSKATNQVPTA